ncbi:MAG TPA: hypothetical protein VF510_23150 [Ktedonobacterales bacterium]
MARRRRGRRMPWLTLIALALVERWMARGRGGRDGRGYYPRTNNLARFLVLERLGYYSPWLIGLRFLAGVFRRRDGGGPMV